MSAQRVVSVRPINWMTEIILGMLTGGVWTVFVTLPRIIRRMTTV